MSRLVFPDTTVLINFALLGRLDLLRQVLNGKGAWCATISQECDKSSRYSGLSDLEGAHGFLGEPLHPTGPELQAAILNRDQLASPGDKRWAHMGEAETFAIIESRGIDAIFVTDDSDARRYARSQNLLGISTWDLLRAAIRFKFLEPSVAWGYVKTLADENRGRPPGVHTRAQFDEWLAQMR